MLERMSATGRFVTVAGCASLLLIGTAHSAGLTSADTNQDGRISRAEANASQEKTFKHMDTNGDGQLDAHEFDAGQSGLSADADAEERSRRKRVIGGWFKNMDTDGSGTISRSEYRKALTPYFDRLDSNGDGYLSVDELKQAFGGATPDGGAQK